MYQLNVELTLMKSSSGTSFTDWSEDDWLETRFSIDKKFMFNQQRYDNIIIRNRMNQWSLELSYGNKSNLNKIWTEFHLFLDYRRYSTNLINSTNSYVGNICYPPVISPLTNDSNVNIPELVDMDKKIANYFISDGFFRTINYIHCTINDRRRNPLIHIEINIYLVTNRQFQSLLYIEISNITKNFLSDYQARFYIHNNDINFKYNFNISNLIYPLNSGTKAAYMVKLYNQIKDGTSNSIIIASNIRIILLSFCLFVFIK